MRHKGNWVIETEETSNEAKTSRKKGGTICDRQTERRATRRGRAGQEGRTREEGSADRAEQGRA